MLPVDIKKKNDNLLAVQWDDGHESLYDITMLRKKCPCATCRSTKEKQADSPLKVLSDKEVIPEDLELREAQVVGRYALQFTWSDGHTEGIYSFDYLRKLCQCDECKSKQRESAS